MRRGKKYTFLYVPEDHGPSRQLRIPRWSVLGLATIACALVVAAAFYAVGFRDGSSWVPGGSRLQHENRALRSEISRLDDRVGNLRAEMDDVYQTRNLMATVLGLPVMSAETYAAGVGGRAISYGDDVELTVPAATRALPLSGTEAFRRLGAELDLLRRQAGIQKLGYQALLDTLAARQEIRDAVPSIRPVDIGWLSSRFGFRPDPFTGKQKFHRGLDFSVPVGTPVRATADGVVVAVQQQRGLGNVIKIAHGNDVMTLYAHLDEVRAAKGDRVVRGQTIATSGNSGRSTAPHLHYEIRLGDRPVNALAYILDSYASRD